MIDRIKAVVRVAGVQIVTVDVGPVSLAVHVSNGSSFKVGDTIQLYTHMHWNQEQGPSLFGFASELERAVFLLIIGCSGLGPKIALAALAQMGPQAFLDAIQTSNERALSKVSGIGIKKAEQMVVQLRHKVAQLFKSGLISEESSQFEQWGNIAEVLSSLNYTRFEVTAAMSYLGKTHAGVQLPFDQLMRHALSFLAKKS